MSESRSEEISTPDRPAARRPGAPARAPHVPMWTAINYGLDMLLGVVFVVFVAIASVIRFVFPAGIEAYSCRLWGRSMDDWRSLEYGVLSFFGLLVIVHVTLHWNWVCSVTNTLIWRRPAGRDNGGRTLLGVALLIVILHMIAAALLYARFSLERPGS